MLASLQTMPSLLQATGQLDARRARIGLVVYGGVVLVLSALCEGLILARVGPLRDSIGLVYLLMWCPAAGCLVARLVLREGVRDISFRPGLRGGGWREWLIAWLYSLPIGTAAYGIAWYAGLARFAVPESFAAQMPEMPAPALLGVAVAANLTLGTLFSALSAAGEELGWRGYLLPRLIDAGIPRPILVSSAVWALWHMPLVLSGQYVAGPWRALSAAGFLATVLAAGYVAARVRLASGSVWPAVVFHAAWNAVIQDSFDPFTASAGASHRDRIWVGESGLLVAAASILVAGVLVARPLPIRRFPGDPDERRSRLSAL